MIIQHLTKALTWGRIISLIVLFSYASNAQSRSDSTENKAKDYDKLLIELEQSASEKNTDSLGTLISTISFHVKTDNKKDYEEGFIPWIELEHPNKTINKLIDKDEVVIRVNKVTAIIDYPLKKEYRFELTSANGFTRKQLVDEISKAYHRIFEEEQATSTIKITPKEERKLMYNRNQTDGKYGIWGHDLADLVLADILVYETPNGELLLSLNIES